MPEINYFAVAAGALATFVVGGLWYSPVLFGKAWQRETGLSDEQLARGNMLRIFGITDPDDLDIQHLLDALQLKRIGLYPDSEDLVAVFDYAIDEQATDYLLAVEFDGEGAVIGISMDS